MVRVGGLDVREARVGSASRSARRARRSAARSARAARGCPGPGPIGGWFRRRDLTAPARESFRALVAADRRRAGRRVMTGRPTPARSSSSGSATRSRDRPAAGRRSPRDYERGPARRDRRRRAVRRARRRLPGDRQSRDGGDAAGRHRRRRSPAAGAADRGPAGFPTPGSPSRTSSASRTTRRCRGRELDGIDGVSPAARSRIAETGRSCSTRGPARVGGRSACCPTSTSAWCAPTRSSATVPEALPASTRRARRRGSAGRPRPATSSSSASRASTARDASRDHRPRTDRPEPAGIELHRDLRARDRGSRRR